MRFTVADALDITGGSLLAGDAATVFDGAWQDSRTMRPGALFVPLIDQRDGHEFVPHAIESGAAGYVTARRAVHPGGFAVAVDDTRAALVDLARAARPRVDSVVGITGSAGKTTTKDFLGSVLRSRFEVGTSEGSFNNEIGMPLTMLNAPDDAEVVVVEIGARKEGDVAWGTEILAPTIGIVTNVGTAHIGEFGSREHIARAKGELPRGLGAHATAILNADDRRVAAMADDTEAAVLTFGTDADVRAEGLDHVGDLVDEFVLVTPSGSADVALHNSGPHIVSCALAAAAAGHSLGIDARTIAAALPMTMRSPHRMVVEMAPGGWRVLNDAYNANPDSMHAALHAAARLAGGDGRLFAILGHMAELGHIAPEAHAEVGSEAKKLGFDVVVGVGEHGDDLADGNRRRVASSPVEAVALLHDEVGGFRRGDVILVKGSRMVGLEAAVPFLLRGDGEAFR